MKLTSFFARRRAFASVIAIPTLLATLYFGLVASDVYVSEARFVVRAAERPDATAGIGALFKGFTTAGAENILFVRDYLLSQQVVGEADRQLRIRDAYRGGDFLSRFPAPWDQDSAEAFNLYYQGKVQVEVDPQSAVGVLTVRGFAADDVHALNEALLEKAATRIKQLNAQIRKDTLGIAETELARAQKGLHEVESKLAQFRTSRRVIDPERQAGLELQSEQELAGRLVSAQSRMAQVKAIAPQSPQLSVLAAEIRTLEGAIAANKAMVTGATGSRAASSEAYQTLTLEREIASRTVAAAHEALIRARVEVERRHLYLEMVSAPSKPDAALYPKRFRSMLASILLGLLVYAVGRLLISGIREHREVA